MDRSEVRNCLMSQNPHYRSLLDKHREYEEKLAGLRSRRWLSEEEKLEEVRIKKYKLAVKDEMERLVRSCAGVS